jgi:purine-binding chemotaxis protein CheW
VLNIQEVIRRQQVTVVPLAGEVVCGLLNLRGSIVTTVDLRRRFGMAPVEGDELATNIVCQTAGGLVSLLVDRIGDVVEVNRSAFEPPPETVGGNARELIEGVYMLPGGLMSVVNIERVVEFEPVQA